MKYLLLCIFSSISSCMIAQTSVDSIYIRCLQCDSLYNEICEKDRKIFGGPDELAKFPGSDKELLYFINKTLLNPLFCSEERMQGRVVVKFIIDESGKIICPYIRKSLHPVLDKEALRVVKLMPDWKPAIHSGRPCKSCFTLPISFKL